MAADVVKSETRIPRSLNERLAAEAKRRGLSKNTIIVLALEAYLGGTPPVASPAPSSPPADILDFD